MPWEWPREIIDWGRRYRVLQPLASRRTRTWMEGDTGLEPHMGKENGIPMEPMWVMRIKGWGNWEAQGPPGMGSKNGCRSIWNPNMRLWLQRVSGSAWSRQWEDGPQGTHRGKRRKMEVSGVCKQLEMLSCKTWVHYLVDHRRNYVRVTDIQASKWIWLQPHHSDQESPFAVASRRID